MRFKIDENLHTGIANLLCQAGHDAIAVFDQDLQGHSDIEIASVCREEKRAIVTMDLDFSDIREFPPQNFSGIIVLRLDDQSRANSQEIIKRLLPLLDTEPLVGCLWIVDEKRIRIRGKKSGDVFGP